MCRYFNIALEYGRKMNIKEMRKPQEEKGSEREPVAVEVGCFRNFARLVEERKARGVVFEPVVMRGYIEQRNNLKGENVDVAYATKISTEGAQGGKYVHYIINMSLGEGIYDQCGVREENNQLAIKRLLDELSRNRKFPDCVKIVVKKQCGFGKIC